MIKAVLLDLDDTLLHLDTNRFVERYLMALAEVVLRLHPSLANNDIPVGKVITRGVRAAIGNLDPSRSNVQVFTEVVCELLNLAPDEVATIFTAFQENGYSTL